MHDPATNVLTRRSALKALAATPLLWPGLATAQPGASGRVTVGLIGCGRRASQVLPEWVGSRRIQLVAVCDVDTTRRENLRARGNELQGTDDVASYNDYRELLQHPDLDAVGIFTPDHWHATQLIHAANAGKHIYCEKPLTHTLEESRRCIQAVRHAGVVMQTGSQQRSEFGHKFTQAADLARSGALGAVTTMPCGVGPVSRGCGLGAEDLEPGLDWDRWLGPTAERPYHSVLAPRGVHNHFPRWRDYREWAGGLLADFGAHFFDIAQWAMGYDQTMPVRITPPTNRREVYGAVADYADGRSIPHTETGNYVSFVGSQGVVRCTRGHLDAAPDQLLRQPLPEGYTPLDRPSSHFNNWIDCVHSGDDSIAPIEAGAHTAAICHLFAIAYWTGQTLTFDPNNWRFTHDEAANAMLDYERRAGYELPQADPVRA